MQFKYSNCRRHTKLTVFYARSLHFLKPQWQPQLPGHANEDTNFSAWAPTLASQIDQERTTNREFPGALPSSGTEKSDPLALGIANAVKFNKEQNTALVRMPGSGTYVPSNWTHSVTLFPNHSSGHLLLQNHFSPTTLSLQNNFHFYHTWKSQVHSVMPSLVNTIFLFYSSEFCPVWGQGAHITVCTNAWWERMKREPASSQLCLLPGQEEQIETHEISPEHKKTPQNMGDFVAVAFVFLLQG